MKFIIRNIYKYSEELEIEADSEEDAIEKSKGMEFNRNEDDLWYDQIIKEIK